MRKNTSVLRMKTDNANVCLVSFHINFMMRQKEEQRVPNVSAFMIGSYLWICEWVRFCLSISLSTLLHLNKCINMYLLNSHNQGTKETAQWWDMVPILMELTSGRGDESQPLQKLTALQGNFAISEESGIKKQRNDWSLTTAVVKEEFVLFLHSLCVFIYFSCLIE